jgi:sugar/nucleoside kinase (ribokinase family)
MNFLVIGHSVIDRIFNKDSLSVKPGGIIYTVISLSAQVEPTDKIYLCSSIDNDNEELFKFIYDRVENKLIKKVKSIPTVELVINESGERKETYTKLAENLILPVDNLNIFDGILINMITGYDLSLQQLNTLRKNYKGLIYFDVHTLSRGVNKELKRKFRRIKDFDLWAECIDILQANENELNTLSEKSKEAEIVKELIIRGIRQVIVTRSERGASVFYKENNVIKKIDKDAVKVNSVNKVGCGDVFGAVYFYNYIKNKNVDSALEQAVVSSGIATTYNNQKEFLSLKQDANEWPGKK